MQPEGLQHAENRILCQAVQDACTLHAGGDAWAGYRCLTEGLERVRTFAAEGTPWAERLAQSYLTALEEYTAVLSRPTVIYHGETASMSHRQEAAD